MNKLQRTVLGLLAAIALTSTISSSISTAIEANKSKWPSNTNNSGKGAEFFQQSKCTSCHSIEGKGGCLAPPLDGIGSRRSKLFVESRITKDEKAIARFFKLYPYAELLEHPRLPPVQAKAITSYLLTLDDLSCHYKIAGHKVMPQQAAKTTKDSLPSKTKDASKVAEGRLLFNDRGCLVCHSVRNMGGHFAPALDGISTRHDRRYVSERITAAEFFNENGADETKLSKDFNEYNERGAMMPPSDLNAHQVESITDYLMSLPLLRM